MKKNIFKHYQTKGFKLWRVKFEDKKPYPRKQSNKYYKKIHATYNPNWLYCIIPQKIDETKGLCIIDVDVKNNKKGLESLEKLENDLGIIFDENVISPSGGLHIYVTIPKPIKQLQKQYEDIDFQSYRLDDYEPFYCLGGDQNFENGYYELLHMRVQHIPLENFNKCDFSLIGDKKELEKSNNYLDNDDLLDSLIEYDSNKITAEDARLLLSYIEPKDFKYSELLVIMASIKFGLKAKDENQAFEICDEFFQKFEHYDPEYIIEKWNSLEKRKENAGAGSLFYLTKDARIRKAKQLIRENIKDIENIKENIDYKNVMFKPTPLFSKNDFYNRKKHELKKSADELKLTENEYMATHFLDVMTDILKKANYKNPKRLAKNLTTLNQHENEEFEENKLPEILEDQKEKIGNLITPLQNKDIGAIKKFLDLNPVVRFINNGQKIAIIDENRNIILKDDITDILNKKEIIPYFKDLEGYKIYNLKKLLVIEENKIKKNKIKKELNLVITGEWLRYKLAHIKNLSISRHEIFDVDDILSILVPIINGTKILNPEQKYEVKLEENILNIYLNLLKPEPEHTNMDITNEQIENFELIDKYYSSIFGVENWKLTIFSILNAKYNKRNLFAPIWVGIGGTGKTLFFETVSRIFGENSKVVGSPDLIGDRFLESTLHATRAYIFDDISSSRKLEYGEITEKFKTMINATELRVEEKFKPVRLEKNITNFFLTTNKFTPLPVKVGEVTAFRRYIPMFIKDHGLTLVSDIKDEVMEILVNMRSQNINITYNFLKFLERKYEIDYKNLQEFTTHKIVKGDFLIYLLHNGASYMRNHKILNHRLVRNLMEKYHNDLIFISKKDIMVEGKVSNDDALKFLTNAHYQRISKKNLSKLDAITIEKIIDDEIYVSQSVELLTYELDLSDLLTNSKNPLIIKLLDNKNDFDDNLESPIKEEKELFKKYEDLDI